MGNYLYPSLGDYLNTLQYIRICLQCRRWVWPLGWEDPLEKGTATQYSGLENSMDYIVHGVTKSWSWLSNFHIFIITKTNNIIIISTHKDMCSSCCVNKMPQSPTPGPADGVNWRVFSHGSNLPRAKHILPARPCQSCVSHRELPPHWEEDHQTVL